MVNHRLTCGALTFVARSRSRKPFLPLKERVSESLGLLYQDHWPYRQPETSRGIRRSPLHEHLKERGAVFGVTAGWERANWFADEGQEREYRYSWGPQNWFENAKREHMAVRTGVGLFDMSSFGKLRIEGRDAWRSCKKMCANQMDTAVGKITYTQMLNRNGGIESDLTITRLGETSFLAVVLAATVVRDMAWMKRHIGDMNVVVMDATASESVLCLMGPKARDVLAACSPNDFSNEAHPFGTMRQIEIGMGLARAHRVTYVGELGWEIYASADQTAHIFEVIEAAGAEHDLKLAGLHVLDSCRIEKAFRHFGHDITDEDHVLEAGLGFAVKIDKGTDFIGREAVIAKKETGLKNRMVQFKADDPSVMLYHNEPILRDGEVVSFLTSGNYGHYLGASIGMGYVPTPDSEKADELLSSKFEVEVAGERVPVTASLKPMYDPKSDRVRM